MRKAVFGVQNSERQSNKDFYEEKLSGRFYETKNRLSWECEENPPLNSGPCDSKTQEVGDGLSGLFKWELSSSYDEQQQKGLQIRYHCRMCGQPKHNHICPMLQSLQRSIGVMVYPTLNAFTASEPGQLAPSLSDMNNFIASPDTNWASEKTPSRFPISESMKRIDGEGKNPLHYVTPDAIIRSSANSNETSPDCFNAQRIRKHHQIDKKDSYDHDDVKCVSIKSAHFMFHEMDLKPEQYRIAHVKRSHGSYIYPEIPLPYAQRKQLSDFLLTLSSTCSQLRDECASVLQEGREKGMWDLAVAELITQVIVLFNCHACDVRLDGLSNYLRTFGISC